MHIHARKNSSQSNETLNNTPGFPRAVFNRVKNTFASPLVLLHSLRTFFQPIRIQTKTNRVFPRFNDVSCTDVLVSCPDWIISVSACEIGQSNYYFGFTLISNTLLKTTLCLVACIRTKCSQASSESEVRKKTLHEIRWQIKL